MESILQDIRYSWLVMRKNAGFTFVVIMTLALGVGANTAVFSVVKSVLLNPLPYPNSERLVKVTFSKPGAGLYDIPFSEPELNDLRLETNVFEEVSVVWPTSGNLTGGSHPERLELLATSPNYFSMLGAIPQLGRLFGPQDIAPGFAEAVVISDGLWRRLYGADPNILGKRVFLDDDPYTIVGVLRPEFRHPGRTLTKDVEMWVTAGFRADPFPLGRSQRLIPGAIALVRPGLNPSQAHQKLDAMAAATRLGYPGDYHAQDQWSVELQPLLESLVGNVRPMLLVLMGAVVVILLIGSVNIANLLLARASTRHKEMALRSALGATGSRMIRQLLTESLMLSLIGGGLGILFAIIAIRVIVLLAPPGVHRLNEVSIDWAVLGFALLITVITGLAFGLVPALQSSRTDMYSSIREGSLGSGQSKRIGRYRIWLIMSEMALTVVLMIGAGLLLRTFWGLLREDPGFNTSRVVTAGIWLPNPNDPKTDRYSTIEVQGGFVREALRRISGIPGVELAAATSSLPSGSSQVNYAPLAIENQPIESSSDAKAEWISVSPDYFKVLEIPLQHGRLFNEDDKSGKPEVAIIDKATAGRYWPGANPLGKRIKLGQGGGQPWVTVVGVINDVKHDGLDKDGIPHIYRPDYQTKSRIINFVVRTSLPASVLERQIREEIQTIDPGLPVYNVRSMDEVVGASLAIRRFSASLVAAFAVVGLLLVSIGIYGILAHLVSQRSREIAVRMALGARAIDIFKMILGKGALIAAIGILCGLLISLLVAPAMKALLYSVPPIDPPVFIAVPALLLGVALLASFMPARKAAGRNPNAVLHEE